VLESLLEDSPFEIAGSADDEDEAVEEAGQMRIGDDAVKEAACSVS